MSREGRTSLVGLLFVISGALGLVYQVAWFKYLSLFLGNTTVAQAIVLATFMGGLAIGASLWGRRSDVHASPLELYGRLEIGIGLYCLAFPVLDALVRMGFISVVQSLGWQSDGAGVQTIRLVVSMLMLLPPTMLMGGTLPVLVRTLSRSLPESGTIVATLYFLNSFGAIVGTLLGGFFFVRLIGLQLTVVSAAIANLLIGAGAIILGRGQAPLAAAAPPPAEDHEGTVYSERTAWVAIIVAGLSGMAAMVYEVAWVRMLIPVLGSSTYSFSLMLAAFIAGITIGSVIVSGRVSRSPNLVPWLAGVQAGAALAMLVSLSLFVAVPYIFWKAAHILVRSDTTYPLFLAVQFVIGFLLLLVPTVFLGMSLPIATRIAARSLDRLGRSVGTVFTINTAGTVIGTLSAGFLLIPWFGAHSAVEVGIAVNAGSAIIVLMASGSPVTSRQWVYAGVAGAALIAGAVLLPSSNPGVGLAGVFRLINKNTPPPPSYAAFQKAYGDPVLRFYREGTTATVGVIAAPIAGGGTQHVLIINGKADASSNMDLPTQVLLGQLPALFHPDPRTAFVIGFGSGVTAGSILRHPVGRVDCAEISPEVIEAEPYFEAVNNRPLADPRFNLHVEDALAYLQLTQRQYDLIVSEPSNPWIAGIGSLYTREFFETCRARMTPGGVMAQWFHLYEIDGEMFKLVLRTFASVFPHVSLWKSMTTDVILIGSDQPLRLNSARLSAAFEDSTVARDLSRILIEDPLSLLTLEAMGNETVRSYAGDGGLNTEDLPALEYGAPRAFFVNQGVVDFDANDERLRPGAGESFLAQRLRDRPATARELLNAGRLHATTLHGNAFLGYQFLKAYLALAPKDEQAIGLLAEVCASLQRTDESLAYRKRLVDLRPGDPAVIEQYAWRKFEVDIRSATVLNAVNIDESERLLRSCVKMAADSVDLYRIRLADMFYATKRYRLAMDQYARALQIRESHARDPYISQDQILYRLASCLYLTGDRQRAVGYAIQAVNINPSNEPARDLVFRIWTEGGTR